MIWLLVLCFPALAIAQFGLPPDRPLHELCGHSTQGAGRQQFAALDAESLHTYDQLRLELDLRVEHADVPLVGYATITLVARESLPTIPFNAEGLAVTDVWVNNLAVSFVHILDTLHVQRTVALAETVAVRIAFSAEPNPDWNDVGYQTGWEQAYTFSEPYGARRWYPCWDQPSDKFSTLQTRVNMPEHWSLAANGALVSTDYPEAGRKRQTYEHDRPISPYLVSIAAGLFAKTEFTQDNVFYRYYVWPWDSLPAAYDWERTPQMTAAFVERFGPYPFAQYGMAATDIFGGWGAMEHQTFTTYGFNLVDSLRTFEGIVAHELAHMWFGDHLSPVDFRNMWLNEGFATYGNLLWVEHLGGENELQRSLDELRGIIVDEARNHPPLYPVYDPPPDRLFGVNQYYKGAWVLHMLRGYFGLPSDSTFFPMMQAYVDSFAGGTVSTEDFYRIVSMHYPEDDLRWFFDQWVYGVGHPVIEVAFTETGPHQITATARQVQPWPERFRTSLSVVVTTDSGPFHTSMPIAPQDVSEFVFDLPDLHSVELADFQAELVEASALPVMNEPATPLSFSIGAAYPNPFNPSVTIPLELSQRNTVTLSLFDLTGRQIAQVFSGELDPGTHDIQFEAPASLAAGMYLLRARSGASSRTQKLLLLK